MAKRKNGDDLVEKKSNNIDYDELLAPPPPCFDYEKTGKRPKKILNATGLALVSALRSVNCSDEVIASRLGCSVDLFYTKHNHEAYVAAKERGEATLKLTLHINQLRLSRVNAAMAIFLGKQILGQSDNPNENKDDKGDGGNHVTFVFADTSSKGAAEG